MNGRGGDEWDAPEACVHLAAGLWLGSAGDFEFYWFLRRWVRMTTKLEQGKDTYGCAVKDVQTLAHVAVEDMKPLVRVGHRTMGSRVVGDEEVSAFGEDNKECHDRGGFNSGLTRRTNDRPLLDARLCGASELPAREDGLLEKVVSESRCKKGPEGDSVCEVGVRNPATMSPAMQPLQSRPSPDSKGRIRDPGAAGSMASRAVLRTLDYRSESCYFNSLRCIRTPGYNGRSLTSLNCSSGYGPSPARGDERVPQFSIHHGEPSFLADRVGSDKKLVGFSVGLLGIDGGPGSPPDFTKGAALSLQKNSGNIGASSKSDFRMCIETADLRRIVVGVPMI
ncbi:hypothetical protein DFH09DRAFT_1277581 [Mycena vulgaris]|nr:hypothetical protein DFH09DRAFT_1277581 [Mycena vulgaris]